MKKRIVVAFLAFFAIMLACTLLAFAIIAINTASQIGSYVNYENDSDYFATEGRITTFWAYTDSYVIEIDNGGDPNAATFFEITGENFKYLKNSDFDETIKEGNYVSFIAAKVFVGASWNRCIVEFSHDGTEYLSYETGKANLLAQQHKASDNAIKAVSISGSLLLFCALGLATTYIIAKKDKVFAPARTVK